MNRLHRFFRNARGGAIVEFAFALPILITLMVGILQTGVMLYAKSGMRNGVGEGLRFAKVYRSTQGDANTVLDRVKTKTFGVNKANIKTLTYQRTATANGEDVVTIAMTYQPPSYIPFVPYFPVTLSETRTVYLPE